MFCHHFFSSVHRNLFTQVCQTLLPTAYTSTELPGQLLLERSHQEFCGTAFSTPCTILHQIFSNYRHICYKFCSNLYYLNDSMIFSTCPFTSSRYELGSPVFLGLAGGFFILVGAVLYAVTVYKVIRRKRYLNYSTLIPFLVSTTTTSYN